MQFGRPAAAPASREWLNSRASPPPRRRRARLLRVTARALCRRRCKTIGAVCSWWRVVSLEAQLLPDLNLNCLPLFAQVRAACCVAAGCLRAGAHRMPRPAPPRLALQRSRSLPDFYPQRASFIQWLLLRRPTIK